MTKVDFRNIEIKDINGLMTKADVTKLFGNMLYMQGQSIEECELGQAIYHQGDKDGPESLELDDKQCEIVKRFAAMLPYVMRTGLLEAVKPNL